MSAVLLSCQPGDDPGPLEDWPFDNPASAYVIRAGAPRTSGRMVSGGPGHVTRAGYWRCTPGAFECTEQGDELMVVLAGHGRLTDLTTGDVTELAPGVTLLIRDGSRVLWTVEDTLTKAFHAYKSGGY